jgi:malonyl-CoA O-methyltransferase
MPHNSRHTEEFSKRAKSYQEHNVIQKKVAKRLIEGISSQPKKILDLGCGEGAVFKLIDWEFEQFVGVDKAENMCALHPYHDRVTLHNIDFENSALYHDNPHFDITIAASSLQWAKDLDNTIQNIAKHSDEIAFGIFCDGTFKSIYEITKLPIFLPSYTKVLNLVSRYFDIYHDRVFYKLDFEDNLSKFRYIKNSGVSGGNRQLNYHDTKKLITKYPHDYLEFEVLFIWGKVKG